MLILDMFNNYKQPNDFNKFGCKGFINIEVIHEINFVDVQISPLRNATLSLKPLLMF